MTPPPATSWLLGDGPEGNGSLLAWLESPIARKLAGAAIVLLLILVAAALLRRLVGRTVQDADVRYRVRKAISFLSYFAVFLVLSSSLSDRLGQLAVAFGVAGAGIAFALQEVIASVAGWAAVSLGGFYATGDRVQLGGIVGDVIDVGVLRTTLMECGQWVKGDLYNGRIVRVANSFVFKEPVFNYSGDFPFLWDEITIPVRYGSDRKEARELLGRVAEEVVGDYARTAQEAWPGLVRKYRVEDAQVAPMVTLVANDNWLEFTVRYVVDYKRRRGTKDRLYTRVLDEIERTEGKVSLASATFELVGAPSLDVRLARPQRPG